MVVVIKELGNLLGKNNKEQIHYLQQKQTSESKESAISSSSSA